MDRIQHDLASTYDNSQTRNLVICCDGTGNQFGDENSNVVKLYTALIADAQQLGYYHPGVGTMGAPTARGKLEKEWTRLLGLGFGRGFLDNLGDAYRYLMNTYREGDKIFIFGFSRGAYTARALAGMLHVCGLLCPGNEGLIPYALKLFAGNSRNRPERQHTMEVATHFKDTFSRNVLVDFVGVWDTVSSVGWISNPLILPDEGENPIMKAGRHAISIDERRCFYRDKLWGKPFPASSEFPFEQDIKQVWFAGVHSDVGGSYPEAESGLSKLALEWMLQEACSFGLRIKPQRAEMVLGRAPTSAGQQRYVEPDPAAMLHGSLQGSWWLLELLPHTYYNKGQSRRRWRIPLGASRTIPEGSLVHESVVERMKLCADYRPKNLPRAYKIEPRKTFPAAQDLKLAAD